MVKLFACNPPLPTPAFQPFKIPLILQGWDILAQVSVIPPEKPFPNFLQPCSPVTANLTAHFKSTLCAPEGFVYVIYSWCFENSDLDNDISASVGRGARWGHRQSMHLFPDSFHEQALNWAPETAPRCLWFTWRDKQVNLPSSSKVTIDGGLHVRLDTWSRKESLLWWITEGFTEVELVEFWLKGYIALFH